MFGLWRKKVEVIEPEWHKIYMGTCHPDEEEFLRENFVIGEWRDMRKQTGYFNMHIGYEFKHEEDAMAFKLRWM